MRASLGRFLPFNSLRAAAVAALLSMPGAFGAVTAVQPKYGSVHRLDGWAGRNRHHGREPGRVRTRYTPGELAIARAKRYEKGKRDARQRLLADFYNPCVNDQQMIDRHGMEPLTALFAGAAWDAR